MAAPTHTNLDLNTALDTAEAIARQAGAILRQHYERAREATHKSTVIDLVTAADKETEAFIVEALLETFPGTHIVGEEGGGYGADADSARYHWYVDPLDGTVNFAHRMPFFSVSLALSDADLNPLLGVVFDPLHEELFKGLRGQGAMLNGRPLRVTEETALDRAMLVTGFPYDRWTNPDNNSEQFEHFLRRAQAIRCVGSAALDLCYVAAGRYEGYWESGPNPWDVQAGILFVEEAGGRITDYSGARSLPALRGNQIVASNGRVHDQMIAVLTQGDDAPRPNIG